MNFNNGLNPKKMPFTMIVLQVLSKSLISALNCFLNEVLEAKAAESVYKKSRTI